jgi:hypothetical protein
MPGHRAGPRIEARADELAPLADAVVTKPVFGATSAQWTAERSGTPFCGDRSWADRRIGR